MYNLQFPSVTPFVHKKKRVFRQNKGHFITVRCADCEEHTTCYSHSQTDIKCKGCSAPILKSSGGRAIILNKAGSKKAESVY